MSGFQQQVSTVPAPGVAGDFASANPVFTVLAGPGALVSGAQGLTIGHFCWLDPTALDPDNAAAIVNPFGTGPVAGFVHRNQQGLITTFLANASMTIPQGFPVTVMSGGDFWVKNDGAGAATVGMKAYARFSDGAVTFAATASPSTGGSATSSSVAASTNSFTGSISGNVLTTSGAITGSIYPGTTISGTNVATGTMIVSQLTGTPSTGGTFIVSIPEQTVASTTISGTYGTLTIGTLTGVPFAVNDTISGSSVVAGTTITAPITGAGGTGATMAVNNNTVVSSTTITVAAINVETKFIAMSSGAAGELLKISDHALG